MELLKEIKKSDPRLSTKTLKTFRKSQELRTQLEKFEQLPMDQGLTKMKEHCMQNNINFPTEQEIIELAKSNFNLTEISDEPIN